MSDILENNKYTISRGGKKRRITKTGNFKECTKSISINVIDTIIDQEAKKEIIL